MDQCVAVGGFYENGASIPQDLKRAKALYDYACKGGSALGCYQLGLLYDSGRGVSQDPTRARSLYRQGCSGGEKEACKAIGLYLPVAPDVGLPSKSEIELEQEARLAEYEKACNAGYLTRCVLFGQAYLYGITGAKQDFARARAIFEAACDASRVGDSRADFSNCLLLAGMYSRADQGVAQDLARAKALRQRACDAGFGQAR